MSGLLVKPRLAAMILLALFTAFLSTSWAAAQALSQDRFAGYEQWPLYAPGDLAVPGAADVGDLRIAFEALFAGGEEPVTMNLWMDVLDVSFKGRPAQWIQWTFSHDPGEGDGAPNMDLLVVDRETQQLLFRLYPGNTGSDWVSPYGLIQATPGVIRQIGVDESGVGKLDTLSVDTPMYEFATLGFLFPFLDLEEGKSFRLATYHFPTQSERRLPVRIVGPTHLEDAAGNEHDVWAVEVGSTTGETIVTHYVSKNAPYWYGWHYQRVSDGASLFKMTYKGWIPTGMGR